MEERNLDRRLEREALPLQPWQLALSPPLPQPDQLAAAPPLVFAINRCEPLSACRRETLVASLTPAERQRLEVWRHDDDRERFLRGRAALRLLLAQRLGVAPQTVPLLTGPHGKPHCPGGPAFNLSHSGDLILLALHNQRPVGVDVERERPGLNWRPIAQRVLTPAQCEALERRSTADAPAAFLSAWCRLEAQLKARGDGLAGLGRPLLGIEVWDVAVPAGYRAAAALASAGPGAGDGDAA
jgi:4'-phosphopantetheinyl transferase